MSRLLEDLVSVAHRMAKVLRPPPVEQVLLPVPDDAPGKDRGSFCAVQLSDGSTGLAYALLGDTRKRWEPAERIEGRDALSLAEGLATADPAARALGLAAVNALSRHLFARARFAPDFAANSLGSLTFAAGDRLGMVGFFPPLVQRAREAGIPLTVLELKPELVQEAPGLTVTLDPARLAECTEIVCTSATVINDSLDGVLAHARGCREFVLVGPSASCVPDPLFARGVTGMGGAWVTDPPLLMERARRGERWGDATRKYSLRATGWPGLDALLRRALQP